MANKPELRHLPNRDTSSILISNARSDLFARARRDIPTLAIRKPDVVFRAVVKVGEKWGYIDRSGEFVVQPTLSVAHSYSCGRAAFSMSPKTNYVFVHKTHDGRFWDKHLISEDGYEEEMWWGYLDFSGKIAIPPTFESVQGFSEDLAAVKSGGKWGFIDKDGKFVIEPRFTNVMSFKEGLAIVRLGEKCGCVDRSGQFVIPPNFDYLWRHSEGLALAEIDGKCGYVDKTGKFIIAPQFEWGDDFKKGVAMARCVNGKLCFVNTSGQIVFACDQRNEGMGKFTNGISFVDISRRVYASECGHEVDCCDGVCDDEPCSCEDSKKICGECTVFQSDFIDRTGHSILSDARLFAAGAFRNGLGAVGVSVQMNDGNRVCIYGYVDNQGRVVVEPKFARAGQFRNGFAKVETIEGEQIYIDKAGETVKSSEARQHFYRVGDFHDGLAMIQKRGAYGFVNAQGVAVVPLKFVKPLFAWAEQFKNGMARVSDGPPLMVRKYGFIDTTGRLAIPMEFDDAGDFEQVEP